MHFKIVYVSGLLTINLLLSQGSYGAIAQDTLYVKECGSCHMAYPAHLLPKISWGKIMGDLGNHFGESAELNPAEHKQIAQYLEKHSGDAGRQYDDSDSSGKAVTVLRITKTPRFIQEHKEVSPSLVKNNPKVKSLSQCDRCHPDAKSGSFNEDNIMIPGVGRWDD